MNSQRDEVCVCRERNDGIGWHGLPLTTAHAQLDEADDSFDSAIRNGAAHREMNQSWSLFCVIHLVRVSTEAQSNLPHKNSTFVHTAWRCDHVQVGGQADGRSCGRRLVIMRSRRIRRRRLGCRGGGCHWHERRSSARHVRWRDCRSSARHVRWRDCRRRRRRRRRFKRGDIVPCKLRRWSCVLARRSGECHRSLRWVRSESTRTRDDRELRSGDRIRCFERNSNGCISICHCSPRWCDRGG